MRDPHPRPSDLATAARPDRAGSCLTLATCWRGSCRHPAVVVGGFRAGYALRRRQEANRARLACPACRAAAKGRRGP